jgi:beta-phosphoglucomutase-like phosphatase (HAD superfamily)
MALVKELCHNTTNVAVSSASENTKTALKAGIIDFADAIFDGHVLEDLDLNGRSASEGYLQGAKY